MTKGQCGFIKGRTTELQLLNYSYDWVNAIDTKCFADNVYIDPAKAFDNASHNKLLHKLHKCGTAGNILQWLLAIWIIVNRESRVGQYLFHLY